MLCIFDFPQKDVPCYTWLSGVSLSVGQTQLCTDEKQHTKKGCVIDDPLPALMTSTFPPGTQCKCSITIACWERVLGNLRKAQVGLEGEVGCLPIFCRSQKFSIVRKALWTSGRYCLNRLKSLIIQLVLSTSSNDFSSACGYCARPYTSVSMACFTMLHICPVRLGDFCLAPEQ